MRVAHHWRARRQWPGGVARWPGFELRLGVERMARVALVSVERMHSPIRRQGGLLREAAVGCQHGLPTGVLCRCQYVIGVRVVMTAQILERVVDENELWHGGACDIINSMTPDPGNGRHGPARLSALLLLALITSGRAVAGVSAYLPLSLAPEVEARIERVLALAGVPVMTRPIRVATVVDALSSACAANKSLCRQVRRDLAPYLSPVAITGRGGRSGGDAGQPADPTRPARGTDGQRLGGLRERDWRALAAHALVSVGAVGNSDRVTATGTMVSLGWDGAQFDVGYRDHWWSPFRLGSMLIGTEAATMPSVTVSNVEPLTRAHLRYELFLGRMSYSDRIEFNGGYTAGYPQLFGFHVEMEPAPGWTLGLSRMMQYGGGDRPSGFQDMVKAFFNPARLRQLQSVSQRQPGIWQRAGGVLERVCGSGALPHVGLHRVCGGRYLSL